MDKDFKENNKEEKTIGKDYKICKLFHKAENVRCLALEKSFDHSRDILVCIFLVSFSSEVE